MAEVNWKELAAPFAPEDIEWRVQQSGMKGDRPWAMVLAYIENRAIQQRLDDVVGPENWRNEYEKAPEGGVICGLSIRVGTDWVTKWDGADNTDFEAVKGGLSNAMKRAAVQWGIGRYLYKLEATFADVVKDKGDHYFQIKEKKTEKVLFTGYWNTPKLPAWAVPEAAEKKPTQPSTSQQASPPRAEAPKQTSQWEVAQIMSEPDEPAGSPKKTITPAQSAKYFKQGRLLGYTTQQLEERWRTVTTKEEASSIIQKQEEMLTNNKKLDDLKERG